MDYEVIIEEGDTAFGAYVYYEIPPKRVAELRQMMDEMRAAEVSKKNRKRNAGRKSSTRPKAATSKP